MKELEQVQKSSKRIENELDALLLTVNSKLEAEKPAGSFGPGGLNRMS